MTTIKIPLFSEASRSTASYTQEHRKKLSDMSPRVITSSAYPHAEAEFDAGVQTRRKSSRKSNQMPQHNQEQVDQKDVSYSSDAIIHTPRRGRRVGQIDLGWESPLATSSPSVVTPTKRKHNLECRSSDATVKLVDLQGRALAAMPKSYDETITTDFLHNSPNLAIEQNYSGQAHDDDISNVLRYDRLSGFEREEAANLLPALVPIEIPSMGRMAIRRAAISEISCIDTNSLTQSSSEQDSISSSNSGNNSQSSDQTSLGTPNELDSLSSFPLPSDFLYPESKSPSKSNSHRSIASLLSDKRSGFTAEEKIQALREMSHRDHNLITTAEDIPISWRPKLLGDGMPELNWPDSPNGAWSGAGKELLRLQEQKRRGIARWLEEDSSDDDESSMTSLSQRQQHPMVAKAILDRARKEVLIRSLSLPILRQNKHLITPGKRSRRSKVKEEEISPAKRRRGRKVKKLTFPHPLASGATSASTVSSPCSTIGCLCGSVDDSTPMVQCDACKLWYHLACMGITANDLEADWFCSGCCDMAASFSPSSLGDQASLIATPNFPRSAAIAGQQLRPSQGQLPVFTHPASAHSPSMRIQHLQQQQQQQSMESLSQHSLPYHFPSALALAPSPVLPTSNERRSSTLGRHRASRIGWQQLEPGSPLQRKSGLASGSLHSSTMPSSQMQNNGNRRRIPTFDHPDAFYPVPPRTPSPQPMSTPSRKQSSNNLSGARSQHRRESSNRDFDDIFSTPSRILQGSASWGTNPTTSMVRHTREDSGLAAATTASVTTPWGLSTPIRSMMENDDFSSDRSEGNGGLPSLVFSSGGMADLADFNWQMQSPSSSTRAAARARQASINRKYMTSTSSLREKTPTRQSSSNTLGQQYHQSESHTSSSPFPKTPTFQDLMQHHHHHQQQLHSSHQHPSLSSHHQLQYSPSSAPNKSFTKASIQLTPGNLMTTNSYDSTQSRHSTSTSNSLQYAIDLANEGSRRASIKSKQASNTPNTMTTTSQARARNASSGELMAGLGIGLDLDDVLDWA